MTLAGWPKEQDRGVYADITGETFGLTDIAVYLEIIGPITGIETIAAGGRIRNLMRLRKQFGVTRWRKMKGIATIQLRNGALRPAEVHRYEAHGIGRRKMKIKQFLE